MAVPPDARGGGGGGSSSGGAWDADAEAELAETFIGTLQYMPPECLNSRSYGFGVDIWALGLTVLACALGRYPLAAGLEGAGGGYWGLLALLDDEAAAQAAEEVDEEEEGEGEEREGDEAGRAVQVPRRRRPPPGFVSALAAPAWASPAFADFLRRCLRCDPAQRPSAEALVRHPWLAGCEAAAAAAAATATAGGGSDLAAGAPLPADESMAGKPGTEDELKLVVRRVQKHRFHAALAARASALPPLPPALVSGLGAQMGLPAAQVARAFAAAQAYYDEQIARLRAAARGLRAGGEGGGGQPKPQ